jgi:predicted nucleic acid-binding protein
VSRYHLDTDFLVKALFSAGPERELLRAVSDSAAEIEMSALAWYEFCRGPRQPQQEAVARSFLETEGVLEFDENCATRAADIFRRLGSPRRRAFDVAIAATALERDARLLTGNTRDYSGIEGLLLGAGSETD